MILFGRSQFISVSVTLALLLISNIPPQTYLIWKPLGLQDTSIQSTFTEHNPIIISSDADFEIQGWPGNGTQTSPYRIENLSIASNEDCIRIGYTNVLFIVRNCTLSSIDPYQGEGISLDNVNHGIIENCTIVDKRLGVLFEDVTETRFENCVISNNRGGIGLIGSNNCSFTNNRIIYNDGINVDFSQCTLCELRNNTIIGNSIPEVMIYRSESCFILENYIQSAQSIAMNIIESFACVIQNNTCIDSGVQIQSWLGMDFGNDFIEPFILFETAWVHHINRNTVNGKPLGYFYNESNRVIDGQSYGQVILVSCDRVNVSGGDFENSYCGNQIAYSNDCTLQNASFMNMGYGLRFHKANRCMAYQNSYDNGTYGMIYEESQNCTSVGNDFTRMTESAIYLEDSPNCEFEGESIQSGGIGIMLCDSDNCVVRESTLITNQQGGILVDRSSDCIIEASIFANNDNFGVDLFHASRATISSNVFENDGLHIFGYTLAGWSHNITNNVVNNKTLGYFLGLQSIDIDAANIGQLILVNCSESTIFGGSFSNVSVGLELAFCRNCTIQQNLVAWNFNEGIHFFESDNCSITGNRIYFNGEEGIQLGSSCEQNSVFLNAIGWNAEANGKDYGVNNTWDGNFWSDYTGDGDYEIAGSGGGVDGYPLTLLVPDYGPPFILHCDGIQYVYGSKGNHLIWNVTDAYPFRYQVFRNGALIEDQLWNGSDILVIVDGHDIGIYEFTLMVYDVFGSFSSDITFVNVIICNETTSTSFTTTTGPSNGSDIFTLLFILFWIAVIMVEFLVIYIMVRRRTVTGSNANSS